MKYFLLIGGFSGFLIVFASGVGAGKDLSTVLCNATVGCLLSALLFRGFRHLLAYLLRQVEAQQAATEVPAGGAAATVK